MQALELRVLPIVVVLIMAAFMWLTAYVTSAHLIFANHSINAELRYLIVGIVLILSFVVVLSGAYSFKKAQTTVNPKTPDASAQLVTSGIYRFTRNPMYIGFLGFLVAYLVFLANLYASWACVAFVFYMNQFQIKPEERMLKKIFTEKYTNYQQQVRRWV